MIVKRINTLSGNPFVIFNDHEQVLIDDGSERYMDEPHFVSSAPQRCVIQFATAFEAADKVREIIRYYDEVWASEESLRRAEAGPEEFGEDDPIEDELRAYEETA